MPYGLKSNGLIFGSALIIWSSFTSSFGLYLQNKVAKYTDQQGAVSFFSLCQLTYPQLSIIFDAAIAIKCFGVGVSYLVVIGDLMPKIMESAGCADDSILMERNLWISLFMFLVITPLSYLKKLDSLKYTSVVALVSVVYLVCLVVGHFFMDSSTEPKLIHLGPISWVLTLNSFPIFVFAYTCHQNMFAILNELEPSEKYGSRTRQSNFIIRNSIFTACISYLIVGILGYLTFADSVNANIITMYRKDSMPSLIGRLCIVIMVSLSFPLQCHPCRGSVNHVIHFILNGVSSELHSHRDSFASGEYTAISDGGSHSIDESFVSTTPMEGAHDTDGHDPIIIPLTKKKFYIITTVIVVTSYITAVSVKSLARVLAFVGTTGSTSISFILPGLFGYMLIRPLKGAIKLNAKERLCKYGGFALSVWGVIVMVVCLSVTIFIQPT